MPNIERKQKRFVQEYLIDLNATKAAIRAGYSQRSAATTGSWLLQMPHVQVYVDELVEKRKERTDITSDRVLTELAKIAFLDIRAFYNDKGNLVPVHELPPDVAATITDLKVSEYIDGITGQITTESKIKILDKLKSLELIGRHLRMFTDKIELDGSLTLGQIVKEIQDRSRAAILPPPGAGDP